MIGSVALFVAPRVVAFVDRQKRMGIRHITPAVSHRLTLDPSPVARVVVLLLFTRVPSFSR
jgi:hypothetical protein